jgi:hypothetical protein
MLLDRIVAPSEPFQREPSIVEIEPVASVARGRFGERALGFRNAVARAEHRSKRIPVRGWSRIESDGFLQKPDRIAPPMEIAIHLAELRARHVIGGRD